MHWRLIFTIYAKELRDLLRDRRTVISMIIVPTLVMPGLFAVVAAISFKVTRQVEATTPTIIVLGGDDSPRVREALSTHRGVVIKPATENWRQSISDKKLRAAVEIPAGFDAAIERGENVAVTIYNYAGEMRSDRAVRAVREFFDRYGERVVVARLAERGLSPATINPFDVKTKNVAPPEKVGGNLIGGIVPYFFLLLAFTGAMYPAMDLTAGEKERGTMETLLCSPAPRLCIVLGKFLMILTASLGTVACSLLSTTATLLIGGTLLARKIAADGSAAGQQAANRLVEAVSLDPAGLVAVVGLVLPMVVLFAAVLFTISLFAKGFKEAQSYVSPLIVVIVLPAVVGLLPGVELNARLALIPILNVSLASKELVSGVWHWGYLGIVFGSTCLYAGTALALAVRMFNRESVLFRA